ncbi:hypothetical protein SAMN04244573_00191 [Azotobacter beijerinckii]|uniref:Uncharacterized protein n=1 Tax=Azotobacter beijerinckii TaxID=170623 RepID=A0A1H8ZBT1_9GAMM|nr:hypothetical protein [Azotobacter beijerinckii]SEP61814.1 hypothetical protein SAMN04244573_00191 [Azotobacter beijerinckii]
MKNLRRGLSLLLLLGLPLGAGIFAGRPSESAGTRADGPALSEAAGSGRLVRDGIAVEFAVQPVDGTKPTEGMFADLRFRLRGCEKFKPLLSPLQNPR